MGENQVKTEEGDEADKQQDTEEMAVEEDVLTASSADGDDGGVVEDIDDVAQELLAQGKRNLVIGEIVQAVQSFQEASALLGAKYGETANECGEAYFKYGTALLELARMETGVLGNALDGVPDDADSDDETTTEKPAGSSVIESVKDIKGPEREKIFKDVYNAMDEDSAERKKEKTKKENGSKTSSSVDIVMEAIENDEDDIKVDGNGESKKDQQKDEDMKWDTSKETDKKDIKGSKNAKKDVTEVDSKSKYGTEGKVNATDATKGEDGAGCSKDAGADGTSNRDENADDEDTADDVSNFQLAWEMLELARVIFLNEDREKQLQVAHVHLTLGELSMETENYAQSIKDFFKCLALQETHLETDSRRIAETHYNFGLVYCLDKQFEKSIESFGKAMEVIKQRIANLRKKVKEAKDEKEKDDADSPLVAINKEIKQLDELIPDITGKIEDSKEMKKNAAAGSSSSSSPFAQSSSSSSAPAKIIPIKSAQKSDSATDISHLMRKKRKSEGSGDANESKSKNDVTETHGSATNGHGNGDANGDGPEKKKTEDCSRCSSHKGMQHGDFIKLALYTTHKSLNINGQFCIYYHDCIILVEQCKPLYCIYKMILNSLFRYQFNINGQLCVYYIKTAL